MGPQLALAVTLFGATPALPDLPTQTLIFYNARLAGREARPTDVLKLWLLHTAAAQQRGLPSLHEDDFLSLTWAALGESGFCPDGLPRDVKGAGVWPLALHNWFVKAVSGSDPPDRASSFDAFEVGQQQREIALSDVLSAEELRSVTFFRTHCLEPWLRLLVARPDRLPDFTDRLEVARQLRLLLREAKQTLVASKVEHQVALDARLFDLDLMITELQIREARRLLAERKETASMLGVATASLKSPVASTAAEETGILKRSLGWSAEAWLTLTPERRLYLFSRAMPLATEQRALDAFLLGIIDALVERRQGAEVEQWIGWLGASKTQASRALATSGDRGRRLLDLDRTTGFRERAVIALHRGVAFLEAGDETEALRSFAWAVAKADDSRDAAAVQALARRWLSFVLARFQTTDELLASLAAILPRPVLKEVLEELLWAAALNTDAVSFERCARASRGLGSSEARADQLRSLAAGKVGPFATELRRALEEEPHYTLRFVRKLVEQLEASETAVRRGQRATLEALAKLLVAMPDHEDLGKAQRALAVELGGRVRAVLEALSLSASQDAEARASELSPARHAFAGSVRLAPADPLPWPFVVPEPSAPSVFTPFQVRPVEWREADGTLVMGFRVGD